MSPNGRTVAGSQVYKCQVCKRKYTPVTKAKGHDLARRQQALCLTLDGYSQRQAVRHAEVTPQSAATWLKQYADDLPNTLPGTNQPVEVAEQDELSTFVEAKKQNISRIT